MPQARGVKRVSGRNATSWNRKGLVLTVQIIEHAYAGWGSSATHVATSPMYTPQRRPVSTPTNQDTGCSFGTQGYLGPQAPPLPSWLLAASTRRERRLALLDTSGRCRREANADAGAFSFERCCATPNSPGACILVARGQATGQCGRTPWCLASPGHGIWLSPEKPKEVSMML